MILILDDNLERLAKFTNITQVHNIELKTWLNAPNMLAELAQYLPKASLISLDHDLYKQHDSEPDVGCGRDVANYLATLTPVCPVIIHSTNLDAAWGMYNELYFANWQVEVVSHTGLDEWYQQNWWLAVQTMITGYKKIVCKNANIGTM